MQTYVSYFKVLPHEEIEGRASLSPNTADGRAAVVKESGTEVCAKLSVVIKQQLRELKWKHNNFSVVKLVSIIT